MSELEERKPLKPPKVKIPNLHETSIEPKESVQRKPKKIEFVTQEKSKPVQKQESKTPDVVRKPLKSSGTSVNQVEVPENRDLNEIFGNEFEDIAQLKQKLKQLSEERGKIQDEGLELYYVGNTPLDYDQKLRQAFEKESEAYKTVYLHPESIKQREVEHVQHEKQRMAILKKADQKLKKYKIPYKVTDLFKRAFEAGESLFGREGSGLDWGGEYDIKVWKLSDLIKDEENSDTGTWSYLFYPSTGKGLDNSEDTFENATDDWIDSDGRIYMYHAEDGTIDIVIPDRKLSKF